MPARHRKKCAGQRGAILPDFYCDVSQAGTPFDHFWEHSVGSGNAELALRADWQAQLSRCRAELGFQHVRFHNLLSERLGALVIVEDEPLYSFFNLDRIYDFLLSIGMRPFVELSFMPPALASGAQTVFHYQANVTPPKDYRQWAALIGRLVGHLAERYGPAELEAWHFEVWNEPNVKHMWGGSQADYFRLYRHTAEAIKAIHPDLQVGGPATARNAWLPEFIAFGDENGVPADFVTTHHYPNDAFGPPEGGTRHQLAHIRRSVLREQAQDAKRQVGDRPLYYTEWNTSSDSRDPLHDEPYGAAFVAKTIMEAQGIVQGYDFWTFSDIFEESYFPSQPYHGGFGLLNLYGVPKPSYRAFELLHRLGERQLLLDGLHTTVDAWAVRGPAGLDFLLTNHALPDHPIRTERVRLHLTGAGRPAGANLARIDADHANPRAAWEQLGSPEYLDQAQVAQLEKASEMHWEPLDAQAEDGRLAIELSLPPQAIACLNLVLAPGG
ncbi:MAG: GH39 family glycosyl hydrolase [Candidatus Promineifilaceae bacterium]